VLPESAARGPRLLAIARTAIEREDAARAFEATEDWLRAQGASFVTLRLDGELRGCIGTIDARRPLGEDVARNACAAAYRDPRFPPVTAAERPALAIEVSVLSPRVPFEAADEAEAAARLRPLVDGVYLQYGESTATFLPQVWEGLPDPIEFLAHLRSKAGLPPHFWHPGLKLWRYSVEKYL
jgi:AmmeMemoRadiSam system protein A